ncbi:MAG: hypothetical protein U5K84_06860 [Alkalibacterium sp.]|nr:hypothetical protein [Alkalibacterium sp.]
MSQGGDADLVPKAGQRLPYVDSEPFRVYPCNPAGSSHTFKPIGSDITAECDTHAIKWIMRKWTNQTRDKGFSEGQWLLVRPDGYIGWTGSETRQKDLIEYIHKWLTK